MSKGRPNEARHWPQVRLDEIAEVQLGKMAHPKSRQGIAPFPYLRNANVQWGKFDLADMSLMDFDENERAKFSLRPGDLVVCEGGEPGRAAVWEGQIKDCYFQKALFRIRPFEGLADPRFLMYRLWFGGFTGEFTASNAVTTISHLPLVRLCQLILPVPPLAEQELIASRLTEQLAAVERARAAAQARLDAALALPAAYLREVFEGDEARGWETFALADLVRTPIRTGISKPGRPDSNKRCLTLSAVRGRTLLLDASKPAEVSDAEAAGNWLRPGCFYVVRGNGNRELVGRGAFAPDLMPRPVLFPDLLFQLDLGERVDPSFFWCLWSSASVRRDIEDRARTAAGIYKINAGNLNSLPLCLPPLADQRRIAADLAARLAGAERLAESIRAELAAIEALPAALLRETFGGIDEA